MSTCTLSTRAPGIWFTSAPPPWSGDPIGNLRPLTSTSVRSVPRLRRFRLAVPRRPVGLAGVLAREDLRQRTHHVLHTNRTLKQQLLGVPPR